MSRRPLSFWGWGYADRFPDPAVRRALADQLQQLFGFPELTLRAPPGLDRLGVPPSRLQLPPDWGDFASVDPVNRAAHAYGRSYRDIVRGLSGDFSKAPDAVVYPRNEREINAVILWCAQHDVALVPFGGGTSLVGGVECSGKKRAGVLTMDLRAMNKVLEVDTATLSARIEAGATGPQIEEQLGARGLTLRHYPQSFEFSTLGGWIATRAAGHYATNHTRIDDLVQSVKMLTPTGDFVTRRVPSTGAGPDPKAWVLGSEGTLGVISEAWVRVLPKPRWRASASLGFEDFGAAVGAAREIAQARLFPAQCRLLDKREALLAQLPSDGRHVLLIGFESAHHDVHNELDVALKCGRVHGGELLDGPHYRDQGEREPDSSVSGRWRQAFFDAPYLHTAMISLGIIVDSVETSVPWARFSELHSDVVRSVRAAIQRATGQKGLVTCRFTHVYPDGPVPYYTFLAPATAGSEVDQWAEIRWAASDAVLRNGGTITHHHGVGRLHRPWYEQERPVPFGTVLQAVKKTLDPSGIMNPGVLVDPEVE